MTHPIVEMAREAIAFYPELIKKRKNMAITLISLSVFCLIDSFVLRYLLGGFELFVYIVFAVCIPLQIFVAIYSGILPIVSIHFLIAFVFSFNAHIKCTAFLWYFWWPLAIIYSLVLFVLVVFGIYLLLPTKQNKLYWQVHKAGVLQKMFPWIK